MIKLLFGDCIKRMNEIADESIDMVLCDLPYGTTKNQWDNLIPFEKLWKCYNRICKKNAAVVLFSQMPFTVFAVMSNLKYFRYEWIWIKNQSTGFLNANKMPLKIHENILVFYEKLPTYNPQFSKGKAYIRKCSKYSSNYGKQEDTIVTVNEGRRYPKDIIKCKVENGLHPTQKPVLLLEFFIKTYTNEGETVLDNCMGSGSTGIACINTGRNFIGIESDRKNFKVAKDRIKDKYKENKM